MNIPSSLSPNTGADPASLANHVAQRYFMCSGYLLADVWLPHAVVIELGRRMGVVDTAIHAAAIQQLIANGWLRAAPNGRWLKLMPANALHGEWESRPQATREQARLLLQDVLLWYTRTLHASDDKEALALVLRQLVHLARSAAAAQDPGVVALLAGIGAGFEQLGMLPEARTAYGDAVAALNKRMAMLEAAV